MHLSVLILVTPSPLLRLIVFSCISIYPCEALWLVCEKCYRNQDDLLTLYAAYLKPRQAFKVKTPQGAFVKNTSLWLGCPTFEGGEPLRALPSATTPRTLECLKRLTCVNGLTWSPPPPRIVVYGWVFAPPLECFYINDIVCFSRNTKKKKMRKPGWVSNEQNRSNLFIPDMGDGWMDGWMDDG